MSLASHLKRIDLTGDFDVPDAPLGMDVRDSAGRLVVKAGQTLSRSLLERLRKMGILEVYVQSAEASSPDYWVKWGEEWLAEARSRLVHLTPENGVISEELDRFVRVLSEAVDSYIGDKIHPKAE